MAKPLHIVVVSTNSSSDNKTQTTEVEGSVEFRSLQEVEQQANSGTIDVLVVDRGIKLEELSQLGKAVDLSNTVVIAGPLPVGQSVQVIRDLLNPVQSKETPVGKNITLEDYVESKFSEFVRAMKASSARSLHSTLIRAVERPMIELALRETRGNQIQAAELLGLNRNTLRKKISECKITVKRRPRSQQESVST